MRIAFRDAANLRTKTIIFDEVYRAYDASTLEQLRELSSLRKSIEDYINRNTTITEAIAKEMAGEQFSQVQQILQKLEQYVPLLENLMKHTEIVKKSSKLSDPRIQWSSALTASNCIKFGGPKYFLINNLGFELGMSLFLYGALLRERAFQISSKNLAEAAAIFRKAAGVYEYLSNEVLAPLKSSLPKERPVELSPSLCYVMSRICLADAQATSATKAEEKRFSALLLSKLQYGVTQILREAASTLDSCFREGSNASVKLLDFTSTCGELYELKGRRSLAEALQLTEQVGTAITILQSALARAKKILKSSKSESYRSAFNAEIRTTSDMLRKLEYEHEFVWNGKISGVDAGPVLEGKIIVSAIPYELQRSDKVMFFKI